MHVNSILTQNCSYFYQLQWHCDIILIEYCCSVCTPLIIVIINRLYARDSQYMSNFICSTNVEKQCCTMGHFPKWWTFSFSRNFPDLEIQYDLNNRKNYVNNISHKVYACTWTPVIDKMLVCKLAQYSLSICSSVLVWSDPLSCRAFIACSIISHAQPLDLELLQC